jgi:mannose-1-phosphate guanylyltransferase
METEHLWTAIIAGGKGTRLFPISHPDCPKQFCQLDERNTFIQAVVDNFTFLGVKPTNIVVITTSDSQTELAKKQCLPRGILSQNILQLSPQLGYAGSMIKATSEIYKLDPAAIIINTPADQYLVPDFEFKAAIESAVAGAKNGNSVIVGVKVNDIVTAMGCGHAIYEETNSPCFPVTGFVEKPDKKKADEIMRQGNSACNTGINVWRADVVNSIFENKRYRGISTNKMMEMLGDLQVAVGYFEWHDCGTLKSLYDISKKSPNTKNATIGGGTFERTDCHRSLLYAIEGFELRVSGAEDDAVVFTSINERPIVVVAKLSDSQKIKLLAEDYLMHEEILTDDFSMGARNNTVLRSNVSDEIVVGFVGVQNYAVYVHRNADGNLEAVVSQQMAKARKT